MYRRIRAIAKKEIRQLKRDTRMLFVLFAFPVLLLVIFGYAINLDVHHIKTVVYDQDHSVDSRNFINTFTSSGYFDVVGYINSNSNYYYSICLFWTEYFWNTAIRIQMG